MVARPRVCCNPDCWHLREGGRILGALVPLRPEEISVDALPRVRRGGVDPEAAAELVRRAAWDLMEALAANAKLAETVDSLTARTKELETQVAALEAAAARRRDPDELVRSLLASTQKVVHEQREAARREADQLLRKARKRAREIENEPRRRSDAVVADISELEALRAEVAVELRAALESVVAIAGGDGRDAPLAAPPTR
jgi:polyhydroxyalkanoate synthesis regulator phasin